ncbi:MAG: response regulator [Myxococcota bacterium]
MAGYASGLVVDASSVARSLLLRSLRFQCAESREADDVETARRLAEDLDDPVVILDLELKGALDWLAELNDAGATAPRLAVTARPNPAERERALALGASAYLTKPISLGEIARALLLARGPLRASPPRIRSRPATRADVVDAGSAMPQVTCEVLDMSISGALVATPAPVPVGTELLLRLELDGDPVEARGRVIRIQEPAWGVRAGVGVVFAYATDADYQRVEAFIAAHPDPAPERDPV